MSGLLFTKGTRTDFSPKRDRETNYDFLDRSSWKFCNFIRLTLERFGIEYGIDQNFLGDFKAKSDKQSNSAIFELLVYTIFKNCSYYLERHPETSTGKRPDFKVELENLSFFLECTLSAASFETLEETNRMNRVIAIVDGIEYFPYWINLHFGTVSTESISKKQFVKFIGEIKSICDKLTQTECTNKKFLYNGQGWDIEISLFKKTRPDIKRSLGITGGNAKAIDTVKPILSALRDKKGSRYGISDTPYVICINTDDAFAKDNCLSTALFGDESDKINYKDHYLEESFFILNGSPINTSVSAVIFFKRFDIFTLENSEISVWHNPFAQNPLFKNILPFDEYYFILKQSTIEKKILKKDLDVFKLLGISKDDYTRSKSKIMREDI